MRPMILVGLLMFVGLAQSAEKPIQPAAVDDKSAKTYQSGTEQNPFVIKILPAQQDNKQPTEEEHAEEEVSQEERTADATWALVWVTLAMAIFTGLMFAANLRLVKDSRKSSQAARDSADAAVSIAIPYLFPIIRSTNFNQRDQLRIRLGLQYAYRNHGQTPGILRREVTELHFATDIPRIPDFPNIQDQEREIVISARRAEGHFPCMTSREIPVADLAELDKPLPARRLYFVGRIEYDDFFGTLHTKTFAVKLFPRDASHLDVLTTGGIAYNRSWKQPSPYKRDDSPPGRRA